MGGVIDSAATQTPLSTSIHASLQYTVKSKRRLYAQSRCMSGKEVAQNGATGHEDLASALATR